MADVRFCNVPAFGEIGVKYQYEKALTLPLMKPLFPDKMPKSKAMDRQYFFNCFNTRYPEHVAALIKHANDQRYSVEADK